MRYDACDKLARREAAVVPKRDSAARARAWLDRHGAHDREVTPLLRARLNARYDGEFLTRVALGIAIFITYK